jgi:hypothetical protein
VSSDFEHLELRGARHVARARLLARSLEPSCPAHPDFETTEHPATDPPEDRDAHVDFAVMRHIVDRMRAAFFHERS